MRNVILIFATAFVASAAHAITLDEAVKAASDNSHELATLKLQRESAMEGERKARAGFMPRVDLVGRHLFSEKFEVLEIEFGGAHFELPATQPYTTLSLGATLDLFTGFDTVNAVKAASLARESAEHSYNRAEEKMRVGVRTLYYRALGSEILVAVAEQNIATLEGHLKDVNSRVRSGVSTRFDALRAEVQLEDAKTEKVSAESNVAIARARLFEAVGLRDDGKPLSGSFPNDLSKFDTARLSLQNVTREDRVAQRLMIDSQARLERVAHAHWLPKVSLFGSQEWYNNTNHAIWGEDERFKSAYSVGVQLRWNLFDGGASSAAERQAAINKRISEEKLASIDQSMPVDLEEAKRKLQYNLVNYKAKLSNIHKAEEAVRLAQGGVRAGTRTNTEVLDAVVDLNRAKAASVKSQVEAIEALGQLELALGHEL